MTKELIDELDIKILRELARDGRIGIRELARKLGKPPSTILNRIRRLERLGVIRGYTALINHRVLGFQVVALIMLSVEGAYLEEVEKVVAAEPNVKAVYDITGEFDVAIIAMFKTIEELDRFIKSLLKNPRVKRSVTSIAFRVVKEEPHVPF